MGDINIEKLQAEIRQLKKKLKQQQAYFNSVVQYSGATITVISLDGTVEYVNQLVEGIDREAYVGSNVHSWLSPELSEQVKVTMAKVVKTKKAHFYENVFNTPTGEAHYYYHLMSPVFDDGVVTAVSVVSTDITKEKETQAALQARERELVIKNKELEQFTYVASHDLQEPLRTISSFSQLLQKRYQGQLDAEADQFIEFIIEASGRMKSFITSLLDYSRIGKRETPEMTDCNEVVADVLKDMEAHIKETGAIVKAGDLPTLKGYQIALRQLFQNLISNAIKFRKPDTEPSVSIKAKQTNDSWLFSVSDNGIGIDEKFKDRIFTIFQRLHTRTEYEGTGIGLAHCRKIIELHKGDIWVESTPGEGSTFYFTIPR